MPNRSVKKAVKGGKTGKIDKSRVARKQGLDKRANVRKDSSGDECETGKEVTVDFEFFNMSEVDYFAIKQFLSVSFGTTGHSINLSDLATIITEECADHVGTCVKSEGEQSDPLGFATCIPVGLVEDKLEKLREYFFEVDETLQEYWDGCVLLLNERFMNLPAGIAGPLLDNLLADWDNAIQEEPAFRAKYVWFLTPTFSYVRSTLDGELGENVDESDENDDDNDGDGQYYYQEAEFLDEFALKVVSFRTCTSHSTTDSRRAFSEKGIDAARKLFIFEFGKFAEFVRLINEKLTE